MPRKAAATSPATPTSPGRCSNATRSDRSPGVFDISTQPPEWRNGIRSGLKIRRPKGLTSSSLVSGTSATLFRRLLVPGDGPHNVCVDRNLALEVVRVTEAAALSAARFVGRGDMTGPTARPRRRCGSTFGYDAPARRGSSSARGSGTRRRCSTSASRSATAQPTRPRSTSRSIRSRGRTCARTGSADALAVVAIAEQGQFLNAPDTYMDKIAVGAEARGGDRHPPQRDLQPRRHRRGEAGQRRRSDGGHPRSSPSRGSHRRGAKDRRAHPTHLRRRRRRRAGRRRSLDRRRHAAWHRRRARRGAGRRRAALHGGRHAGRA